MDVHAAFGGGDECIAEDVSGFVRLDDKRFEKDRFLCFRDVVEHGIIQILTVSEDPKLIVSHRHVLRGKVWEYARLRFAALTHVINHGDGCDGSQLYREHRGSAQAQTLSELLP